LSRSDKEREADHLAINISAVARRALPALRILSKWLMGQLEYITRVEARVERDSLARPDEIGSVTPEKMQAALARFWVSYADFANALGEAFPIDQLPNAVEEGIWLEEDVDMLGFAPVKRGTVNAESGGAAGGQKGVQVERVGKVVHPNTEQLMRISDVLADARLIAEAQARYFPSFVISRVDRC
jgi:hypothetical protein